MNYQEHQNKTNRILAMMRKIFADESLSLMFEFRMTKEAYCMCMEYDFRIPIVDNLKMIEKGNQVIIGFEVPDIWYMQNIHCKPSESEQDTIYRWFMVGIKRLKQESPSKYYDTVADADIDFCSGVGDKRAEITQSDWYKNKVIDGVVVKIMNECELKYRVRRVIGGLFTNPDNICPLIQLDFDTDELYIIKNGKFVKSDVSISNLTYHGLRNMKKIKYNSFEGRIQGYSKGIHKVRVDVI